LIANVVFWIIILFTVVAVLQTLQLEASRYFLNQVIGFIPGLVRQSSSNCLGNSDGREVGDDTRAARFEGG